MNEDIDYNNNNNSSSIEMISVDSGNKQKQQNVLNDINHDEEIIGDIDDNMLVTAGGDNDDSYNDSFAEGTEEEGNGDEMDNDVDVDDLQNEMNTPMGDDIDLNEDDEDDELIDNINNNKITIGYDENE